MQDAISKGATAGVSSVGSLDYAMTRYLFKRAGLDPTRSSTSRPVRQVNAPRRSRPAACSLPSVSVPEKYAVLRRGKVQEIAKMSDYAKDFALEVFWGKEDYIARNNEAVRRFLAAMDDTAQWIRTSPEAPAALAKFIGFTYPEGPDDVKEALSEVHYPTVAEHKARLKESAQRCRPARGRRARAQNTQGGKPWRAH